MNKKQQLIEFADDLDKMEQKQSEHSFTLSARIINKHGFPFSMLMFSDEQMNVMIEELNTWYIGYLERLLDAKLQEG